MTTPPAAPPAAAPAPSPRASPEGARASAAIRFDGPLAIEEAAGRLALAGRIVVDAAVVFVPHVRIRLEGAGEPVTGHSAQTYYLGWLPRGAYRFRCFLPGGLAPGNWRYRAEACHRLLADDRCEDALEGSFALARAPAGKDEPLAWSFEAVPPGVAIENLSWKRGHSDWFFRHFDHAASVVQTYMLRDSPLLRGRILDVGCGDGITALSLALRTGCEELVGVDPFRGYERLAGILAENHLPPDTVPPSVRFRDDDANDLRFEDDRFDVVVSWGSLEHIAGGYAGALAQIRRVLRPGGLFFVHPGLYYSTIGSHLTEFSSEPFFHLRHPREELRRLVLGTRPAYMDRAGEFSPPEQYWQWFTELNPITVAGFEKEIRALGFEPWRVALRTEDLVEYTPELQRYPMQDLATNELYLSCVNRKDRG
jgi:SAM-dependent methyltransferase